MLDKPCVIIYLLSTKNLSEIMLERKLDYFLTYRCRTLDLQWGGHDPLSFMV